jgi:NAD(P)H-hydrate epimerase
MRYACTAAQMRGLDAAVVQGLGLPGIALMEVASRGVADAIVARHADDAAWGVVVVTGPGNNGGDGWAVARWLYARGVPVAVWSLAEPKAGTDAAIMRQVAAKVGIRVVDGVGGCGLVVDALFGTGFDREMGEPFASAVDAVNACGRPVVAVDLPSGLHADSGAALGRCVVAARTVTFGRLKVGMLVGEGPDRCGEIEVVDIGLDAATPPDASVAVEIPDAADLAPLWPTRAAGAHKGSSGHLAIVAGSAAMTGAAILACRGALAAGAGLVTLVATRATRGRLAALPPEVMVLDGGEGEVLTAWPDLSRFDAVAVGPGLGGGGGLAVGVADALRRAWVEDPRPWVADADALPTTSRSSGPRVLTPHPGEAARLLGIRTEDVVRDRLGSAGRLAERGVVLLKGRWTAVVARGSRPSLNPTGSAALATGGSGDVLTGVVGALLARGVDPRDAARLGAFVHGRAGERLWTRRREGWTAGDVASEIPEAAAELLQPQSGA